ncbi:Vmc-like lipoprotein signal peptide domain-containing protein [Ureaplasma urealyticum]|uniref:Vmc-like lipoprotein signal peptide domain-containing protein n=1 Tax=Ureaplasma urealyticum TaxID=2130 RepID=UPI002907881E|nr:iron ABC transporter substrate-binding protein [Ureaplasma urealyticum]MDU3864823.1 iron ABC transporter substrate-binding protein [Ureaplasma urealyticum]
MHKKTKIYLLGTFGLLSFGISVATIASSCTKTSSTNIQEQIKYDIMPTYTSQADNLLALGITPDYYPQQMYWKKKAPYDYLNPQKSDYQKWFYEKDNFANQFKEKLTSLEKDIKQYGTTWWSFSGNTYGEGVSEEYWNKNKGKLVYYDRYLIDNSHFERAKKSLVAHDGPISNPNTIIPVDFKMSRDFYLTLNKDDILNFKNKPNSLLRKSLLLGLEYKDKEKGELNELYNYSYIANKLQEDYFNGQTFDGINFNNSAFKKRVLEGNDIPIFYTEKNWNNPKSLNSKIYEALKTVVLTKKVRESGLNHLNYNPFSPTIKQDDYITSILQHHPIYEQNMRWDGGTQVYLGTMRDSLLYLYDIAYATTKYAYSEQAQIDFKDNLAKLEPLKKALFNANQIAKNLIERLNKIRAYFQAVGVVDKNYNPDLKQFDNTNSKTLGLLTTSQNSGSSTLQTQSKYGFLYYDLGFKAPKPILKKDEWTELLEDVNGKQLLCHRHGNGQIHCFGGGDSQDGVQVDKNIVGSLFNMDDNGWWWNLGEGSLSASNFAKFNSQFDYLIKISYQNLEDFHSNNLTRPQKELIMSLIKPNYEDPANRVFDDNYELWNDGIKSPIGYNMILDSIIRIINKTIDPQVIKQNEHLLREANNWGSYWDKFVNSK